MNFTKTLLTSAVCLALTACSSDDKTKENQLPSVAVSQSSVVEGKDVSITAIAADTDGSIANITWVQKSGTEVTLTNANSGTVSFTAPIVSSDEEIVLTVTVTDDLGATSSADALVNVTANMLSFKLNGLVTDGPIANANVVVTLAGQEFTATADENGQYSLDISVDDSMADQVVITTATGPEENSPVKLQSVVGGVADVITLAGEDGIADKDEVFAVNVTNVTTATSVLMQSANNGEVLTDTAQLQQAALNYDQSLVMPLATAIKLVIDYSEENPDLALPENVSNTLDLVSNLETAQEYIVNVQEVAADTYQDAQQAIITDEEVISTGADNATIPLADTYYFGANDGSSGLGRLELKENGTGTWSFHNNSAQINWTKTDDGLSIELGESLLSSSVEYIDDVEVEVVSGVIHYNIKWLSQSLASDQLIITATSVKNFPNGEMPNETNVEDSTTEVVAKSAGILKAQDIIQLGQKYSLPIPSEIEEIQDASEWARESSVRALRNVVFSENNQASNEYPTFHGNGDISYQQETGNYKFTDEGKLQILDADGSVIYDYVFLTDANGLITVNYLANVDGQMKADSDEMLEKGTTNWTDSSAVGIYNLSWNFFSPLELFWVETHEDGTALTVSTNDRDENGELTQDEIFIAPGLWQINEEGDLAIRRYRYNEEVSENSGYCQPTSFDTVDQDECVMYHERTWDLHQEQNDELYVYHTHRFYDNPWRVWMNNPVAGDLLSQAHLDNRSWSKVTTRPYDISAFMPTTVNAVKVTSAKAAKKLTTVELSKED